MNQGNSRSARSFTTFTEVATICSLDMILGVAIRWSQFARIPHPGSYKTPCTWRSHVVPLFLDWRIVESVLEVHRTTQYLLEPWPVISSLPPRHYRWRIQILSVAQTGIIINWRPNAVVAASATSMSRYAGRLQSKGTDNFLEQLQMMGSGPSIWHTHYTAVNKRQTSLRCFLICSRYYGPHDFRDSEDPRCNGSYCLRNSHSIMELMVLAIQRARWIAAGYQKWIPLWDVPLKKTIDSSSSSR